MKHLLVEGWRGINHSVAMASQFQIIEMMKMGEISIYFKDIPFMNPEWNESDNDAGFPQALKEKIKALPPPDWGWLDCVYSITARDQRPRPLADKELTFMITEFGLPPKPNHKDFIKGVCRGDNMVVVCSNWCKEKIRDFGIPDEKLAMVPLGVSSEIFFRPSDEERQHTRQQLQATPDHFVFLNIGAMTWNKGVDVLLQAFAKVRKRHANARLVLKDNKKLYGFGVERILSDLSTAHPEVLDEDVRSSIVTLTSTLSLQQMRIVYGAADAYVSPYRAEGFNLPVIEAIACGCRAIVTAGGSTDDFCDLDTSLIVKSEFVDNSRRGLQVAGFHLEPDLDDLVEQMETALTDRSAAERVEIGRKRLIEKFSWAESARRLVELF